MLARCEGCGAGRRVAVEDLLDLEPRCGACGGTLVVDEDSGEGPALPGAAPPAKADTAAYRLAAAALAAEDAGVVPAAAQAAPPSTASPVGGPGGTDTQAYRMAAAALAGERPVTTRLLPGREPTEPPLPALDGGDTQALKALARTTPSGRLLPPVAVGDDLRDPAGPPPPADAVVPPLAAAAAAAAAAPAAPEAPTVPMPAGGSTGRGSRVYDRDARTFDRGAVLDKAAAPGDGPPRSATGRAARPPAGGAGARRLFDEDDLDWAKLVDGALPELAAADPDARRIVVRLPASAALQGASDTGRVEALAAMGDLPELARDLIRQDPRASGRGASSDQETQTFKLGALQGEVEAEAEAAPAPRRGASSRRAAAVPDAAPAASPAAPPAAPLDPTPGHVVGELRADRMDPALVVARAPDGRRAAAFDRLAARLLEALVDAAPGAAGRAVLVTSAGPGEGRTGAAANLAMAVARRRGRAVVLVDADPRGRGLPAALGLGPSAGGLHEALRAQADPAAWLHHLPLGRLDLLPLGTPGQDSAALLAGDGMHLAIERLRPRAARGLIVVDGPAALGPGGLCGLEAHVDAVLLVVRAGVTSRAAVRDAAAACGRRLLGVVLLES